MQSRLAEFNKLKSAGGDDDEEPQLVVDDDEVGQYVKEHQQEVKKIEETLKNVKKNLNNLEKAHTKSVGAITGDDQTSRCLHVYVSIR